MRKTILCVALAAGVAPLGGCAAVPVKHTVPFNAAEYEPYDRPGTSVIRGQGFMRTQGGDVKLCAGADVVCVPATSYSDEGFAVLMRGQQIEAADARTAAYGRQTIADGDGRFEFTGLAAGNWYVMTQVYWMIQGPIAPQRQGGVLGQRVSVGEGETKTVILTR